MEESHDKGLLEKVDFLIGEKETAERMINAPARIPFSEIITDFCNAVSSEILNMKEAKAYPDVVTLGFWLRRSSVFQMKERFMSESMTVIGRGIVFHIAPSNVAVNYAYSLFSGIITGNANIVRISEKEFPQVDIINRAIRKALEIIPELKDYISIVRYPRDREINDFFSSLADVRIIWGGDNTVSEIRKSPLKPRAGEITFADRFSLAVIDSEFFLDTEDKKRTARDFYNDTYLNDQNACTSPMLVVWTGNRTDEAQEQFWKAVYEIAAAGYDQRSIQSVDKLTAACIYAEHDPAAKVSRFKDNLIYRIRIETLTADIISYKANSGFFFEYRCDDILELRDLCNDRRVQTVSYLGDKEMFSPLIKSGIHGVDRIVPMGRTMDFDLIWDGYDLYERLTRTIGII